METLLIGLYTVILTSLVLMALVMSVAGPQYRKVLLNALKEYHSGWGCTISTVVTLAMLAIPLSWPVIGYFYVAIMMLYVTSIVIVETTDD